MQFSINDHTIPDNGHVFHNVNNIFQTKTLIENSNLNNKTMMRLNVIHDIHSLFVFDRS